MFISTKESKIVVTNLGTTGSDHKCSIPDNTFQSSQAVYAARKGETVKIQTGCILIYIIM